ERSDIRLFGAGLSGKRSDAFDAESGSGVGRASARHALSRSASANRFGTVAVKRRLRVCPPGFTLTLMKPRCYLARPLARVLSSVVEHYLDTVGVSGSKPLGPTDRW